MPWYYNIRRQDSHPRVSDDGKEKNKKKSETEYKSVKKETAKNKWIESK